MPIMSQDGTSIYYEVHGQGRPLLLLAGLASDSRSWMTTLEALCQTHKVILIDNRGCGRTQFSSRGISIEQMSKDALLLLDNLAIDCADVLGHSMGGMIALDLASRHPERVSTLTLTATSTQVSEQTLGLFRGWASERNHPEVDLREWIRHVLSWLFTSMFMANSESVDAGVEYFVTDPYLQSAMAFEQQVQAIELFRGQAMCPNIQCPTLVLSGEYDRLFAPGTICEGFGTISQCHFQTVSDCAHSVHVEQPERFCEHVLNLTRTA